MALTAAGRSTALPLSRRRIGPTRPAGPRRRGAVRAAAAGPHICIVGGGVAGLTSALRVLDEIPGSCVSVCGTCAGAAGEAADPRQPASTAAASATPRAHPPRRPPPDGAAPRRPGPARPQPQVVAEEFHSDLVSAGAAGYWEPYKLSDTPQEKVLK